MNVIQLRVEQLEVIHQPLNAHIFLEGPAGSGKTTAGVERLLYLMDQGIPGGEILVLTPQRTLAAPYEAALQVPGVVAGSMVTTATLGGLARRMVELFWPMISAQAGFAQPDEPPTFLTLETAQYYMAHLVRPLLDQGYFDSVAIERNRLYSQIIDNLNKAAVVGFPYTEIGERLQGAWQGEPAQLRVYEDAQACASLFRRYCLEHNLLDFSLQVEIFHHHLWPMAQCREHLLHSYQHLIVDNIEEDTPLTHDLLAEWLPSARSSLLIYDQEAGYRNFLGADALSGYKLKALCSQVYIFSENLISSPEVQRLTEHMQRIFSPGAALAIREQPGAKQISPALKPLSARFYPEMLDQVAAEIARLVQAEGVPPEEIVVLAPFLPDSLRFSLGYRLEQQGVPARSHRPSRPLRSEPVTHCLLSLARLAHPAWNLPITQYELAYALVQSIAGLDLVRAQILCESVFPKAWSGAAGLLSFAEISPEAQERITFRLGNRYERLRLWLAEYSQSPEEPFDHFLSRLFGEVLSQPGFGFHQYSITDDLQAGEITANLIESVQKFRWSAGEMLAQSGASLGREYVQMVQDGVIAAQYVRSWQAGQASAVLLAPAYTFLLNNRPVSYQFWLDVGSYAWAQRLYQPLTHPYVLSRNWQTGRVWNADDEFQAERETLQRLALGLLRRCRRGLFLGLSELGEQGFEQRGPLLAVFQRVLRQIAEEAREG